MIFSKTERSSQESGTDTVHKQMKSRSRGTGAGARERGRESLGSELGFDCGRVWALMLHANYDRLTVRTANLRPKEIGAFAYIKNIFKIIFKSLKTRDFPFVCWTTCDVRGNMVWPDTHWPGQACGASSIRIRFA